MGGILVIGFGVILFLALAVFAVALLVAVAVGAVQITDEVAHTNHPTGTIKS